MRTSRLFLFAIALLLASSGTPILGPNAAHFDFDLMHNVFRAGSDVSSSYFVHVENSTDLTTKASAGCPHPRSTILYPDLPCDPEVCAKSCAKGLNNGNGTCMSPIGCDCEYCVPATVPKRPPFSTRKSKLKVVAV